MSDSKLNKQSRGLGADTAFPRLLGERLCLNFVNTIEGPISAHPEDFLTTYAALVRWGRHSGVLSEAEATHLQQRGEQHPDEAAAVFATAVTLRETLYRIFQAVARRTTPDPHELDALQQCYVAVLHHARIRPGGERFGWQWNGDQAALDRVLWPVVQSAVDVLMSGDLDRVKQCPGCDDCGWLFVDTSKNGTRQWCSMEGCGSRAKMRRQYQRKRASS